MLLESKATSELIQVEQTAFARHPRIRRLITEQVEMMEDPSRPDPVAPAPSTPLSVFVLAGALAPTLSAGLLYARRARVEQLGSALSLPLDPFADAAALMVLNLASLLVFFLMTRARRKLRFEQVVGWLGAGDFFIPSPSGIALRKAQGWGPEMTGAMNLSVAATFVSIAVFWYWDRAKRRPDVTLSGLLHKMRPARKTKISASIASQLEELVAAGTLDQATAKKARRQRLGTLGVWAVGTQLAQERKAKQAFYWPPRRRRRERLGRPAQEAGPETAPETAQASAEKRAPTPTWKFRPPQDDAHGAN